MLGRGGEGGIGLRADDVAGRDVANVGHHQRQPVRWEVAELLGQRQQDEPIDHRVGFSGLKPLGTKVAKGEPFAFVHASSEDQAQKSRARLLDIYAIGDNAPAARPVIVSKISE